MATISSDTTQNEAPANEQRTPTPRNADFARIRVGYLLRLTWRVRSVWLGLSAVGLALFAQIISQQGRVDDGFRLYLLACSLFVVAFLFTYRSHRYTRIGSHIAPDKSESPTLPQASVTPTGLRVRRFTADPVIAPSPTRVTTRLPVRRIGTARRTTIALTQTLGQRLPLLAAGRGTLIAIATLISVVSAIALAGWKAGGWDPNLGIKGDEFNTLAMLGWAVACVLLIVACARQRHALWPLDAANPDEREPYSDVPYGTVMQRSRGELLILIAIMLAAAALRFYKVAYTPMGLSLDEGDIGLFAQQAAQGNFSQTPPLGAITWYQLPSMAPLTEAIGLKLFGLNSPLGLRLPTVIAGILVVFVFYQLLRIMFGARTALIGAALIAVGNEQLRFSQAGQGGESMALFWLIGFYFVAKGLRSKRYLDFAWAGLAAGFSLYFYPSSKLIIGLLAAFFIYLIITRLRFIRDYWSHLLVCAIATFIIAAPIGLYTYNNQSVALYRLKEVSILSDQNAVGYFTLAHVPYIPTGKLTLAGFLQNWDGWKIALPRQAILAYRAVNLVPELFNGKYSFYQSQQPLLPPVEAVIVILGLAYGLWRWRDPRYMMFNIWFWLGFFVSVALTILTPDYQRVSGVDISMYAFGAFALTQLAAAIERAWLGYYPQMRDWLQQQTARLRQQSSRSGQLLRRPTRRIQHTSLTLFGGHRYLNIAMAAVIAAYGFQNLYIYYNDYNANTCPWAGYNAPGYYMRDNLGPRYHIYFAGWPNQQYSPQDTRFLLPPSIETENLYNPYDLVPFHQAVNKDVAFLFYASDANFIGGLRQFYPEGSASEVKVPCNAVQLRSMTIPASVITARQSVNVLYDFDRVNGPARLSATSNAIDFSAAHAPRNLNYPANATWYSSLYAPQYGHYQFHISASNSDNAAKDGNATLYLDNRPWLTLPGGTLSGTVDLVMAGGWHALAVKAALPNAAQAVRLLWQQPGGSPYAVIPSYYLWSGPLSNRPFGLSAELTNFDDHKVMQRKVIPQPSGVDERSQLSLPNTTTTITWRGTLTPPLAGAYVITIMGGPAISATLDGQPLSVTPIQTSEQGFAYSGSLEARPYNLVISYSISNQQFTPFYLAWTRPDNVNEHISPSALRPARSVYTLAEVGDIGQLPPAQAQRGGSALKPSLVFNTDSGGSPSQPSAVGVDASGNIYVGDTANKKVLKYDPQGQLLTSWAALPNGPEGQSALTDLQALPNGNVVVIDPANKNIQIYDSSGKYLASVDKGNHYAAYGPNGLATDSAGNIYVANTGGNNIYKLSPGDVLLGTFGYDPSLAPDQKLSQPIDLVLDEHGNMYVCDLKNRLVEYDAQGHFIRQWPLSNGVGHMAYYKGTIYIAVANSNLVYALNTSDGSASLYGSAGSDPGQFNQPSAVAVDAAGNLYVSDKNNHRVQVIANPHQ